MSIFRSLSNLVCARDLQTPLGPTLRKDMTIAYANQRMAEEAIDAYDPMERISLVMDTTGPVGWMADEMLDGEMPNIESVMDPISPSRIIGADTTAFEIAKAFSVPNKYFLFVLDHDKITGVVFYRNLFKSPFRLCLFSLTLELEEAALILERRHAKEAWNCLPENRRRQAKKIYELRFKKPPDEKKLPLDQLLGCTLFCDKATILKKLKLLPRLSSRAIDLGFQLAEKVRNACAHTGPELNRGDVLIERVNFNSFIHDTEELIEMLNEANRV